MRADSIRMWETVSGESGGIDSAPGARYTQIGHDAVGPAACGLTEPARIE